MVLPPTNYLSFHQHSRFRPISIFVFYNIPALRSLVLQRSFVFIDIRASLLHFYYVRRGEAQATTYLRFGKLGLALSRGERDRDPDSLHRDAGRERVQLHSEKGSNRPTSPSNPPFGSPRRKSPPAGHFRPAMAGGIQLLLDWRGPLPRGGAGVTITVIFISLGGPQAHVHSG